MYKFSAMIIRMGHREDLLVGAMTCLREKGYARTTARDIVAASGTNLGSIGYHYGSTEALLNAAVLASVDEWGTQLGSAMAAKIDPDAPFLMRFEQYWAAVLATFEDYRQVWAATFDLLGVAERVPQIRAAVANGLDDGRMAWASLLHGIDPQAEPEKARAVGSLHQALLSGILVQWFIDPGRAPSAADLTSAVRAIAEAVGSG
jgi:AcrR family transcriptional regulator